MPELMNDGEGKTTTKLKVKSGNIVLLLFRMSKNGPEEVDKEEECREQEVQVCQSDEGHEDKALLLWQSLLCNPPSGSMWMRLVRNSHTRRFIVIA